MKDLYIGFIFLLLSFILLMDVWHFISSIVTQDKVRAMWSAFGMAMFLTSWVYIEVKSKEEKP